MPYINPEARLEIDEKISLLLTKLEPFSPGELNYIITKLILSNIKNLPNGLCYSNIALMTGVLENVKQEFYRRVAANYEDEKCYFNGDVY